ncbi:MAG: hypothetical protein AB7I59_01765 [Geminicoccaceae bacterium]
MPTRSRRRSPVIPAILAALCLLGACTTPARLQNEYQGPLPATTAGHRPIALQVEMLDRQGQRFPANNLTRTQYLQLAESAFARAGWVLAPAAPLTARILLVGRTPEGLVASEASLGRNLATGLLTLNTACKEWTHRVDAAGEITVLQGDAVLTEQAVDLVGTRSSCFSMMNPSWLANHQQAALDTYQQAVQDQLGKILELVATTALTQAS